VGRPINVRRCAFIFEGRQWTFFEGRQWTFFEGRQWGFGELSYF